MEREESLLSPLCAGGEKGGIMTQPLQNYTIRIQGHLNLRWSEWFDGMEITHCCNGETLLSGPIADQSALYGLLFKLRDLGLVLLALQRNDTCTSPALAHEMIRHGSRQVAA